MRPCVRCKRILCRAPLHSSRRCGAPSDCVVLDLGIGLEGRGWLEGDEFEGGRVYVIPNLGM